MSVGVLGGIWAFIALAPLAGFALVWAGFIAAGCFFAAGGDTIPVPALGTVWPAIVVGVTVFFLVIVASADVLSCVPANVYGYAALVGYTLSAGKLNALTAADNSNPLLLIADAITKRLSDMSDAELAALASITRFITQKLKLKVNETKSAVARPQERKFLGFSFTTGPDIRCTIAPKSLERFKQRIRDITRRAKGISMTTTMEELAPYMRGWRGYLFRLLRNARGVDRSHSLGPAAIACRSMASVENTASPSCGTDRTASFRGVAQYGRQRPWPLVHRSEQSPLCRALQCPLQIARKVAGFDQAFASVDQ